MAFKAPKDRVVRLRRDPMATAKQLAITFSGLLVVTASLLLLVYAYGDQIDTSASGEFARDDAPDAPAVGASDEQTPDADVPDPVATELLQNATVGLP